MGTPLFPDFLKNEVAYSQAVSFWERQWDAILRRAGQSDGWQRTHLQGVFVNGESCRDGNPIFAAQNEQKNLAIRIIQEDLADGGWDWWIDEKSTESGVHLRELVIACTLTDAIAKDIDRMMSAWADKGDSDDPQAIMPRPQNSGFDQTATDVTPV